MSDNIKTTTSVHLITDRHRADNDPTSDANQIRFGTLRVSPIKVIVSTTGDVEDPAAYQEADRAFGHIRAHLLIIAKLLENDLGPGWSISVEDSED